MLYFWNRIRCILRFAIKKGENFTFFARLFTHQTKRIIFIILDIL